MLSADSANGQNQRIFGSIGCKFFCKSPPGSRTSTYCCSRGVKDIDYGFFHHIDKLGTCPPIRPCPGTRFGSRNRPINCHSDSNCPYHSKCCFDSCVTDQFEAGRHVCKGPNYSVAEENLIRFMESIGIPHIYINYFINKNVLSLFSRNGIPISARNGPTTFTADASSSPRQDENINSITSYFRSSVSGGSSSSSSSSSGTSFLPKNNLFTFSFPQPSRK